MAAVQPEPWLRALITITNSIRVRKWDKWDTQHEQGNYELHAKISHDGRRTR
jgi:hypothetical protein